MTPGHSNFALSAASFLAEEDRVLIKEKPCDVDFVSALLKSVFELPENPDRNVEEEMDVRLSVGLMIARTTEGESSISLHEELGPSIKELEPLDTEASLIRLNENMSSP